MGEINVHHFAHKVECSCNRESYLHKVAKSKFKEIYDSSSEFILEYRIKEVCPYKKDSSSCIFANNNCYSYGKTIHYLDLKKTFNQCLIEEPLNNGQFYADILLKDSSGKSDKVLLIEFWHSHKCDKQKINSGYPIVEIRIKSEKDIITSNRISINDNITLYGFKTKPYAGNELYLAKFMSPDASDLTVIKCNCIDAFEDNPNYNGAFKVVIDPLSYEEFCFDSKFWKNPPSLGKVACAIAYSKGFREFENCDVCVHSRRSKYNYEEIWCQERKNDSGIPKNRLGIWALGCKCSFPNVKRVKYIARFLTKLKYQVLTCKMPYKFEQNGYE